MCDLRSSTKAARAFLSSSVCELLMLHLSAVASAYLRYGMGRPSSEPERLDEAEIRYFLTSCNDDPAVLVRAIRRDWSIENALHWVLDVTFREDDSRVRDRTAARNFALLRKIALNLVARDRSTQERERERERERE